MAKKIQPTCLDTYFSSFEESLASTHMQRRALSNYRFQLRRFGRVLEAHGVEPTSLTLEIADRLARQVPFDRVNAVRIPNLVRRFVLHLISIGVAIPPPVSAAQIAKDTLLDDLEGFLLGQRGLSPSSVYHVKRYAVRFLDHRFGETVPDPSSIRHQDIVAFLEHIQKGKSLSMARTPASHLRCFFQYLFARGLTLIVGTGQSGVQLMDDFHLEGRQVHLAVGPAPRSPRRYRGRDATDWLYDAGHYEITIDRHPDPVKALTQTNHYMSGRDGGKEIDLRKYALEGVKLYGSVSGGWGTRLEFLPDLEKNLDDADRSYVGICTQIDAWIAAQHIDAPEEPLFEKLWRPQTEITEIDLKKEGITSIIWAIGFRPDYSWLQVDCLDGRGKPQSRRGVTDAPGLYFIGLGWLNTWGSGRFLGIDEDSRHLADHILQRQRAGLAA